MAWQGKRSGSCNTPCPAKTCDPRVCPRRLLYLHIISKIKRSIGVLKCILRCTSSRFLVAVLSSLLILPPRPTSSSSSSAAMSFGPLRLVLSAIYHYQSSLLDAGTLIWAMQQSIRGSNFTGPGPCFLTTLMGWAISQTHSLTSVSIRCVVKLPSSIHIPRVSAAHWLTPTLTFSAQTWTCQVWIWIELASVTTVFGNQNASHHILGSQWWSMIEW